MSRTRNYVELDPPAAKSKYYQYALEAIQANEKRFPDGSVNQVAVAKEQKITQQTLTKTLQQFKAIGAEMDNARSPKTLGDILQNLSGADCGVATIYSVGC